MNKLVKKSIILASVALMSMATLAGCKKEKKDYEDYIKLPTYKGIEIKKTDFEYTEAELMEYINNGIENICDAEKITDRPVEKGDIANIDYEGSVDGEKFEGGTATKFDLKIGAGKFIEGFEDGVIGMKIGEEKVLKLKFPDNYRETSLAGKACEFKVTLNEISRYPELSDEVAKKLSDKFDNVADFKKDLKENLDQYSKENLLWKNAMEKAEVKKFPDDSIETLLQQQLVNYTATAKSYNMTLAQYAQALYGYTEEQFNKVLKEAIEAEQKKYMLANAIAAKEGISVSDEDYEEYCKEYVANSEDFASVAQFKEEVQKDDVLQAIVLDKAVKLIVDNCKIID